MRDYGKLSPFFWTRGSGKRLRGNPDAQVVAAYLSTAPSSNMIGIYYVSLATIASDTGVTEKRTRAALKAIEAAGYAFYDFEQEIAWVPNHARFEVGQELRPGDKRRPKVYAELRQVNGHRFADDFRERYGHGWGLEPPTGRGIEGASKGHPVLETDTEGASASVSSARAGSGSGSGQDQDQDRAGAGHPPERELAHGGLTLTPEMRDTARAAIDPSGETVDVNHEWGVYLADRETKAFAVTASDWRGWILRAIKYAKTERMRESDRKRAADERQRFAKEGPPKPPPPTRAQSEAFAEELAARAGGT